MLDNGLIFPFLILLILCVYLIYSRTKFESDVVGIYEEKLEKWKNCANEKTSEVTEDKKVVGIVWQDKDGLTAEFFDESAKMTAINSTIKTKG
mgnify:CR=1 FL=1